MTLQNVSEIFTSSIIIHAKENLTTYGGAAGGSGSGSGSPRCLLSQSARSDAVRLAGTLSDMLSRSTQKNLRRN